MKSLRDLSIAIGLVSLLSIEPNFVSSAKALEKKDFVVMEFIVNGTRYEIKSNKFEGPVAHSEWSGTSYEITDGHLKIEASRYDLYPNRAVIYCAYEGNSFNEARNFSPIFHKKTKKNLEILLRQIPNITEVDWYSLKENRF